MKHQYQIREGFYGILNMENITDTDSKHAKKRLKRF